MSTQLKSLDILLAKADIYAYVTTLTGNIGKRQNAYEQFCCTSDNYAVLDRFTDSTVAFIESYLRRFVSSTYETTLKLNTDDITLHLSDSRSNMSLPSELQGNIATLLRLAVAYNLTSMWLMSINADAAAPYAGMSKEALGRLVTAITTGSVTSATFTAAIKDTVPCHKNMPPVGGTNSATTAILDGNGSLAVVDSKLLGI